MHPRTKTAQNQAAPQVEAPKLPRILVVETVDGLEIRCDSPVELHHFNFVNDDYTRPSVQNWRPMDPEAFDAHITKTREEHNREYAGKIPADAPPTGLRASSTAQGPWLTDDRALKICKAFGVRLVEAQEDEVRGRWDWRTNHNASDTSFASEAEAARDACESLGLADRRVTAIFNPQAWINGNAISVDSPCGSDQAFDVTDLVLDLGRDEAIKVMDSRDSSDDFLRSHNAPKWAKDWPGPFFISVEQSIEDYFDASI